MLKLDHILVCVDGREAGFHALREAIHLAQWTKASVTVMTVTLFFEGDLSLVGVKRIQDAITGPAETVLAEAMRIAASHHVRPRILCEEGHPGEKIVACAQSQNADMIVMGAEYSRSWSNFVWESTLRYVVKNSTQDLFIVPYKTRFTGDDFLAVYGRKASSLLFLEKAVHFLSRFGGKKIIVSRPAVSRIAPPPISSNPMRADWILSHLNDSDILRHAEHANASLILLERSQFLEKRSWMAGLKLEKLIRSSPCPVLVLPTT